MTYEISCKSAFLAGSMNLLQTSILGNDLEFHSLYIYRRQRVRKVAAFFKIFSYFWKNGCFIIKKVDFCK